MKYGRFYDARMAKSFVCIKGRDAQSAGLCKYYYNKQRANHKYRRESSGQWFARATAISHTRSNKSFSRLCVVLG